MSKPSTDRGAIQQIIRALRQADHTLLEVFDGEDTIKVSNEKEALDAIMAVADATLFVRNPEGDGNPWVRFVMGNDPEEVAADYTVSLCPILDPLTESWWD